MPAFRPRVWKQDEATVNRLVRQRFDQLPGVVDVDSDVRQFLGFHRTEQPRDTVDEGFAADEPYIGIRLGLGRKMFAAAEAHLESDGFRRWIE